jgi:chemotaxis protein CheZ
MSASMANGDMDDADMAAWGLAAEPEAEVPAEKPSRLEALIRRSVRAEITSRFDDLHKLVDRRVAELSMEVHATVQLVDYSETNLSGQLARMQEQIAGLMGVPTLEARNSGFELEAVVQTTESAANRIMEAAEAIDSWVRDSMRNPGAPNFDGINTVSEKISDIFEACSFQDLTSQRIRRAIEHLQQVDSMLGDLGAANAKMSRHDGGPVPELPAYEPPPPRQGMVATSGADLAQEEIDRLMAF